MRNFTPKMIVAAILVLFAASSAKAQWGTAETPGVLIDNVDMYDAKYARTSDGGQYVVWTDALNRDGHMTFNLYGQYLDPEGNKAWGEEGKLIDSHMTPSWYSHWNILVTPEDDLVVSWADSRTQEDQNLSEDENYEVQVPVLYKITKAGEMLWGDEGVAMDAAKYRFPAQLTAVGETIYAKIFSADEYGPTSFQQLDEFGEFAWTEDKEFGGQIIASEGTDFIGVYMASEGVVAMRYNDKMEPQWEKAAVISERLYQGYDINPFILKSDTKGGVIVSYLAALGMFTHVPMIGYVTAEGETSFCEQVLDTEDGDHMYGVFAVNPEKEEIMLMWQMTMRFGVLQAEKYDYFGERLWGDMGVNLASKEEYSGYSYGPIAVETLGEDGWLVCYADEIGWANYQLYLAGVDSEGKVAWSMPIGEAQDANDVQMYKNGNDVELVWSCIGIDYDDDWNETPYGKVMGVRTTVENAGIKDVTTSVVEGEDAIYSLDGIRLNQLTKGINIVRKANGETIKVISK